VDIPLRIDFETLQPSDTLRAEIEHQVGKLARLTRITHCHVAVREPHRHHRRGRPFEIHVHLTLPGGEIVVSRDGTSPVHGDPYLAVRDTFQHVRRQLEEFVRVRRGDVKAHSRPTARRVRRIA